MFADGLSFLFQWESYLKPASPGALRTGGAAVSPFLRALFHILEFYGLVVCPIP